MSADATTRADALVPQEYLINDLETLQRLKDANIPTYADIVERLESLEAQQADVAQRITEGRDMIKPYLDQVIPYIERFCNTPVGKMLGMGTKKL